MKDVIASYAFIWYCLSIMIWECAFLIPILDEMLINVLIIVPLEIHFYWLV